MGIEIGKNSFHVVGLDQRGAIVLRQKWSRGQVESRFGQYAAVPDRDGGVRRGHIISVASSRVLVTMLG